MEINRRTFSKTILAGMFGIHLPIFARSRPKKKKQIIMTVNGPMRSEMAGTCLTHEHILVDFAGADKIDQESWEVIEVISVVKPYLEKALSYGMQTFFDATPAYIGRDPELLSRLSAQTGLNIVTNTGYYGASDNKYLPKHAFEDTVEHLAARWVEEWKRGIDDTPVKPGFIKIGVDKGLLSDIHKKLVMAAAQTHLQTGLTIVSHTVGAEAAFEQLEFLHREGVAPEAFVWVHAQEEKDLSKHVEAASKGAWISLDGVREENAAYYVDLILNLKSNNLYHKILISHDAGWYSPGEEHGGSFTPYEAIFTTLVPMLRKKGFSLEETDRLMIQNPVDAFSISVKKS